MRVAVYLDVDMSDAKELIQRVHNAHSQRNFEQLMYRAFKRTGGHVRQIMKNDLPQHYNVTKGLIGAAVGNPEMKRGGGANVSCNIPIVGTRHSIGGTFNATGGAYGWKGIRAGKRYKIKAKIVKGTKSTLPIVMNSYGGEPPFINKSVSKVAFTRMGKDQLPIVKVVGIGIPQMPMNRAQDDVQSDIMAFLMDRIEHEHKFLISKCR